MQNFKDQGPSPPTSQEKAPQAAFIQVQKLHFVRKSRFIICGDWGGGGVRQCVLLLEPGSAWESRSVTALHAGLMCDGTGKKDWTGKK